MGMYNEVVFDCPECGSSFTEQTKTGSCVLKTFHHSNVPVEEISGLVDREDKIYCSECGEGFTLTYPKRVSLNLSRAEGYYD